MGCNGIPTFSKNDKALMFQRVRIMTIPTEFVGQEEYDMRKGEANVYLASPQLFPSPTSTTEGTLNSIESSIIVLISLA